MRRIALRLSLPLLFLCCASFAKADPIVITGGTAGVFQPIGAGVAGFSLLAPGFSANGSGDRNSGSLTVIHGHSDFRGSVTINGTTLSGYFADNVNNSTLLNFTLSPFTLPDPNSAFNTVVVTTAFTMTGNLGLSALGTNAILFSSPITGSGLADITYMRLSPGGSFIPSQVVYNFSPPAATPEPATILLLGTGLTGIAGVVRRRRRRPRES